MDVVVDDDDDDDEGAASRTTLVFLSMTWQRGVLGPTVVARCTDILLAIVPLAVSARGVFSKVGCSKGTPCFPKTVPSALIFKASESNIGWFNVWVSRPDACESLLRHSCSSLTVQAVMIISYNWWSQRKTSFHE